MAPPVAFRNEMRPKILKALAGASTYRDACAVAGIPWATWKSWTKQHLEGGHTDPDVDALIRDARKAYSEATNKITEQVRVAAAKDWKAAAFLLQHRVGDPKRIHDERRARWEAEIAAKRAKGEHVEKVAIDDSALVELREKLKRAIHGE